MLEMVSLQERKIGSSPGAVNASIRNAMVALPMRAVHVEADPVNPEVYADPLFEKVFYNLIDNALRYGGDQMKIIRVSSQESDTVSYTHLTLPTNREV